VFWTQWLPLPPIHTQYWIKWHLKWRSVSCSAPVEQISEKLQQDEVAFHARFVPHSFAFLNQFQMTSVSARFLSPEVRALVMCVEYTSSTESTHSNTKSLFLWNTLQKGGLPFQFYDYLVHCRMLWRTYTSENSECRMSCACPSFPMSAPWSPLSFIGTFQNLVKMIMCQSHWKRKEHGRVHLWPSTVFDPRLAVAIENSNCKKVV
jgi:hypothetical protein